MLVTGLKIRDIFKLWIGKVVVSCDNCMLRQWQLILPPVTLESLQTPLNISHFASQGILWHIRKFPKLNQSSAIKTNFSMIIFQIYWCHLSGHIINIILIDFLCPDFINVNINKTNVHLMYHWQGCHCDMSDNVISRVRIGQAVLILQET